MRVALLALWCPALCLQLHLHAVAGDKSKSHALVHDVADDAYVLHRCNLLMVSNGDGEQQLEVLAAVKRACDDIEVELLGHDGCLIVDGDALLVDTASGTALTADVHEL